MSTALALVQGLWVRRRIEVLPPAGGPNSGRTGDAEAALRIGIIGESTAAGCGVDGHEDGFAGALARQLAGPDRVAEWSVVGEHGATARRIRHRLLPQLTGEFDVVVVLAGANDVMARRSPEEWSEDLRAIVAELSARTGLVVVAGTPPFIAFPSLPRTLARYLAHRGAAQDAASRAVCAETGNVRFVPSPPALVDDSFFSRDGFHPGAEGYRRWAELISDAIGEVSPR
ncbi:SGNH/GDSL hydrolase family protein [Microbacterium bovistercoris]|uniref:SGNH/GDSL hydrolase family protein n=1 Tax=Microbacterium bovistercoris TaxID=2293570 RepID=A0A371NXU3_9MICO|nr:SGNH/GDSL hydrolase family protein [Microbacterium bovistercoris]REJ08206.1 SGNH/GDSL hydrolase family protein [Microbacterium bovistercoris]